MTSAVMALGTLLKRAGVAVAEVLTISDFEGNRDEIDVTNSDSGGAYEKIPGMMGAGDVSLECNLRLDDATGQMQLAADWAAGTISAFTIEGPSTCKFSWSFNAFVKQVVTIAPTAESSQAKFRVVLCVTGTPAFAATISGDLTALVFSSGSLSPALTASVYDYSNVISAQSSLTVTATKSSATLKLYVNDVFVQNLTSGSASGSFSTPVGTTKVRISTQDSGKVARWYTIYVTRTS